MSKRIHELAKEWGQNPKDLLVVAERVGIRGKRSQSALTDEEVTHSASRRVPPSRWDRSAWSRSAWSRSAIRARISS